MSDEPRASSEARPSPSAQPVEVTLTDEDLKNVEEIVNARRRRFDVRFDLDPEYLRAFSATRAGPFVIGSVPGVNDASARTTDFPPTLHELEVLARYYAGELVLIETAYREEGVSGTYECRMHPFANLRLDHLAEFLGEERVIAIVRRERERTRCGECGRPFGQESETASGPDASKCQSVPREGGRAEMAPTAPPTDRLGRLASLLRRIPGGMDKMAFEGLLKRVTGEPLPAEDAVRLHGDLFRLEGHRIVGAHDEREQTGQRDGEGE